MAHRQVSHFSFLYILFSKYTKYGKIQQIMGDIDESLKEKREDIRIDYERKLRRHRLSILYRIVIVAVIFVVIIGSLYYNYQKMVYSDYDVLKTITYSEALNAKYLPFNGNMLRYSQDGASAFNISNDMIWNETFEMQNPLCDVCGDYIAIGDYMGTTIYIYNSEGLCGTIDTSTPLKRFCVAGNGNVAVVLEEEDVTWVKLYDVNGVNVASDRTTMSKSGYPVAVDISDDGILLAVSYLFVDSGVMSTSVAYYNFGAVGQNEIDNLVSGYNYSGTIVPYVKFMNADTSFAVGDNNLVIFKGAQKPESIFDKNLEDDVESVFNSKDYIAIVYEQDEGEHKYLMEIYDDEGNIVTSLEYDLEYSNVAINREMIIIYNSDECEMYNVSGLKKFAGSFDQSVVNILPTTTNSRYHIVHGDCMEEIKLK